MKTKLSPLKILGLLVAACLLTQPSQADNQPKSNPPSHTQSVSWKKQFKTLLPLLGHRNWVLVVDKAYPLQSAAGMTTIYSAADHEEAIKQVLALIDAANHVKPILYTDKEMEVLPEMGEAEAKMAQTMKNLLGNRDVQSIPHDEIFTKLDAASKLFNVVVIKTESTIAYSSLFIELDCGYWTKEKEEKLRKLLKSISSN